jgi:hypothetical protein
MHLKDESLVCTCNECVAPLLDKTNAVTEEQNMRRDFGSNSKKVYQTPVLRVYGTLECLIRFNVNSRDI